MTDARYLKVNLFLFYCYNILDDDKVDDPNEARVVIVSDHRDDK